jgi:hypothetical protein
MKHRTEVIAKDCRYGYGGLIHFEDHVVSSNGRKIPLEGYNTPHNCPFSPYSERTQHSPSFYSLGLDEIELIEKAKKIILNTLNRRLAEYVVVDFIICEKGS